MGPGGLLDRFRSAGISDILDMLFVAALTYFLLVWFKRTKAAFVATGILIFAGLYLAAAQAGMVMTTWIFQGFFAVFLIAVVVIFQEELRSVFERLAVWSLGRSEGRALRSSEEVETLVRTVGRLSQGRTGALIVLRGRDPLDRHLEGGWELDGRLSAPLLESIFDKHSDGHDGAVVIEGERVARFAAHLPLSKDFGKLHTMGTRHAAALGLAEMTDALCVVVSEERGTISLARSGGIAECPGLTALHAAVVDFLERGGAAAAHAPKHVHSLLPESAYARLPILRRLSWSEFWGRNLREKAVSSLFAVVLWLGLVPGFKFVHQDFLMPVVVRRVARGLEVRSVDPEAVRVRLSGSSQEFRLLRPADLRVTVDLPWAGPGPVRVPLSDENVRVPPELRFMSAEPASVTVELERREARR